MNVLESSDDRRILAVLERDRVWSAYALADLDAPYRKHSRFVAAELDGEATAVLLAYAPPGLRVLIPSGEGDGVRAILEFAVDLPDNAAVMCRDDDIPALECRYAISAPVRMLRMSLVDQTACSGRPGSRVAHLSRDELTRTVDLYGGWGGGNGAEAIIESGAAFGVSIDRDLVAVAGAHAFSVRYRAGAIGGVFTHPDYRGRGFAKDVTAAVANHLLRLGIETIVLNVRADNQPAIAAYRAIGFEIHSTFVEAEIVSRVTAEGLSTVDRGLGRRG